MIAEAVQVAVGLGCAMAAGAAANGHGAGTSWLVRVVVSAAGAVGVLAVLAVPLARLPVIVEARAQVVSAEPGRLRLHVWGTKPANRAGCRFVGAEAYVIDGGALTESTLVWEGDPVAGNTRPPGRHDFGTARIEYPPALLPDAALIVGRHRCAWWMPETVSQMGPWPVR